jgi:hypothetical protein
VGAALRQLQQQLDAVDAFVQHNFQGPWEDAGLKDASRHWLDTVARWVGVSGRQALAAPVPHACRAAPPTATHAHCCPLHTQLHTCSTRHGYNSTLSPAVVATVEESLGEIGRHIEQLAMDMFSVSESDSCCL